MITDHQRKLIEGYLPNPRDPDLDPFDYYVLDIRDRPVKVHIVNIAADKYGETIVQVFTDTGRMVHGCYETDSELMGGSWYHMGALYDNREDCRACVHSQCNYWEELRKLQQEESK